MKTIKTIKIYHGTQEITIVCILYCFHTPSIQEYLKSSNTLDVDKWG